MFRGKESSNRIELSRLVQDLLNFGVLGSLQLWGVQVGGGASGGMGGVPTHTHMHVHAHTHLYMYRNCKWPSTWRHPCLACLTCMCMCVCVHACACMCAWDTPAHTHTHPTPIHPSATPIPSPTPIHPSATPRGVDPRNHLKFNNTSTYKDISILFEDLKSVKNSPPMGGCMVWWVGGWFGGWLGWLMGGIRSNH